jgi:hypothetical protein
MSVNQYTKKCGRCNVLLNNEKFFYNGKDHKCCFSCNNKRSNRKNICKTCGINACFNFKDKTFGIYCKDCSEPGMINVKSLKCIKCKKTRPVYNKPGETKALYCKGCSEPDMIDVKNPKCIKCKKTRPVYNKPGETKALYCKGCSEPDMIDVKSLKCIKCKKTRPVYNKPGETKALYCKGCSEPGMINVKDPKCIKCKKTLPNYNKPGETKALYCKGCSEPDMIDVTHPKCIKCKKTQPVYNKPGETKALYCKGCSEPDMIDVKSLKCIKCKKTRPVYNKPGETKALYCKGCSEPDMIDVKSPKCIKCNKIASYGIPCNIPNRCAVHKEEGMIIRPRGRCINKNCNEVASYGIHKPIHCENHKTDNDENLVERKCIKCGTIDIIINGLCVNFCGLTEKHKELKKHQKIKEKRVLKILEAKFMKPTEYNVRVNRDCGGINSEEKEIGFDFGIYIVFVEVDENRHKSYCELGEINRMKNIYMNEGGIPILFIRYNPDNFKDNNNKIKKLSQAKREELLIKWLNKYKNEGLKYNLTVNYLFYDGWNEGKVFEYEIDPYSIEQEFKCDKTNKIFYIKSQYEEHLKKLNQSNQ